MVAFFQRMQAATKVYSDLTPPWLMSHPLTSERISDIQARIREMPYRQRIDGLEFHLVRARARVLQDETTQGLAEAQTAFDAQLKQQNRQQQAAAQYGMALVALKRNDPPKAAELAGEGARDHEAGDRRGVFDRPERLGRGGDVRRRWRSTSSWRRASRSRRAALKEAEQAHQQYPLSRGIARQYAQAMIADGKLDQAAQFLREQVRLYREEPKLYDLLAKTYAAQGKLTLQHIALAESYVLSGAVPAAVDQLGIARKAPDASFYDLALIDARERELQIRVQRRKEGKERAANSGRRAGAAKPNRCGTLVARDPFDRRRLVPASAAPALPGAPSSHAIRASSPAASAVQFERRHQLRDVAVIHLRHLAAAFDDQLARLGHVAALERPERFAGVQQQSLLRIGAGDVRRRFEIEVDPLRAVLEIPAAARRRRSNCG